MNIIYKSVDEILITDTVSNFLDGCKIYIPMGLSFDVLNLYINYVPLEISKITSDKNGYLAYKITPTKILNFINGKYSLFIEGINFTNKEIVIFAESQANLTFDTYNQNVLSYYASSIGQEVSDKYEKIIKIANLCIDIYNSTKEE